MDLARVAIPLDLYVEREMRMARLGVLAVPGADEAAGRLEQEHPGIYAFLWEAIEPEMRRYSTDSHPKVREELAALYQSHLTTAEMDALRGFYETPTGQRVVRTMYEEADLTPVVDDILSNPEGQISSQAVAASQASALAKVEAQTRPADREAGMALLRAVPAAKIRAVAVAVQELSLRLANESDPVFEARLDEVADKAIQKYMKRKGARHR